MAPRFDLSWLTLYPIAHRGLHDASCGVIENSMSAFKAAIEKGYAIECDVHLSKDRVPVVFHDAELDRLTQRSGTLRNMTADELASIPLKGTEDTIPTLAELLAMVDGRVPLVVELKGHRAEEDHGFVDAVIDVAKSYSGRLAFMSFDEWLLRQSDGLRGSFPVGLTAEGTRAETLADHRLLFERFCDFTSYNVHHLPNEFVDWVRKEARAPVISWTARTADDIENSARFADQMTFEGFLPSV